MDFFLFFSLILAQVGITAKQYVMKLCGKRASGAFNSVCINMARAAICLIVSVIIWIVSGGGSTSLTGHLIIALAGIGTAFNLFTWIISSTLVSLTLIESVSMIGSLVLPLILAPYLYEGDTVSPIQWVGCGLVFASVFFFMNKGTGEKKHGGTLKKAAVVIVCAVSTTVASIFKKYYTFHITANGQGSIEYFTFISFVVVLAVFALLFSIFYRVEKKAVGDEGRVELPYKKVGVYIIIAAASLYINELFASYASQLPSAIYYPLSKGLAVLCTFLLDVIAFKDRVTVKKLIGLAVVIAAIIMVNL